MKFTISLIYALASALLLGLLAAYFYFSVMEQQDSYSAYGSNANIALLLFALASLAFSLLFIWIENLPETNVSEKPKNVENTTTSVLPETSDNETKFDELSAQLEKISRSLALTYKVLNLGLQNMNTRLDDIEKASLTKSSELLAVVHNNELDKNSESTIHPNLEKIFNDDLAKTLAELEIMQDSNAGKSIAQNNNRIDLNALLNSPRRK